MTTDPVKYVLGLSGGRDSAALAVYMRQHHPELDIEYFFTDTGKELPEVYEYLGRLEGFLGQPILRLNPDRDFDFWLKQYNNFLPSAADTLVHTATKAATLRAVDQSPRSITGARCTATLPSDRTRSTARVILPSMTTSSYDCPSKKPASIKQRCWRFWKARAWGCRHTMNGAPVAAAHSVSSSRRSNGSASKSEHPDAFEEAKAYEKDAVEHGSPFTWSEGESLEVLEQPERIKQIRADHEQRLARMRSKVQPNPLRPDSVSLDIDDLYGQAKVCLACHK